MIAFVTPTPVHTISAHKIHFDFHSSNRGATECSPLFTRLERRMKENILCVAWCINHSTPFLSCFLNDALPSAKGQIERKTRFLISTGNFVSSRCSKDPTSTLLPNSKRKNPNKRVTIFDTHTKWRNRRNMRGSNFRRQCCVSISREQQRKQIHFPFVIYYRWFIFINEN